DRAGGFDLLHAHHLDRDHTGLAVAGETAADHHHLVQFGDALGGVLVVGRWLGSGLDGWRSLRERRRAGQDRAITAASTVFRYIFMFSLPRIWLFRIPPCRARRSS